MAEVVDGDKFVQLKKALATNPELLHEGGGDSNIGDLVDGFLKQVLENGIPEGFSWEQTRAVILRKFDEVAKKFEAEHPIASCSPIPNVDSYTFDEYYSRIAGCLKQFEDSTPFTLQRILELLLEPTKHYTRGDKFLRAFEKCVTITSANGNGSNGHHHENGAENGSNGHQVNGNNGVDSKGDEPMELNASQQTPAVESENGETKQENDVSSTIVDGQAEQVGAESTGGMEVVSDEAAGSKRANEEEPDSTPKKARVEEAEETVGDATVEPVEKPEEIVAKTGEEVVGEQDTGTAV